MVRGKSGKGKLEASCNQSRFSAVNRVSVRLKISLPVAEPSQGRAAIGTGLIYARSGTVGRTLAAAEVWGLWHIFFSCNKTEMEEKGKEGSICWVFKFT